jgi:hypothetical protein
LWQAIISLLSMLRKKHDLSAFNTLRKMSKRLKTLVLGQDVFGERVELISVWMVAVMQEFAHDV